MSAEIPVFGNSVFSIFMIMHLMTGKEPEYPGGTAFDNY
jgi:hypothetical protein